MYSDMSCYDTPFLTVVKTAFRRSRHRRSQMKRLAKGRKFWFK